MASKTFGDLLNRADKLSSSVNVLSPSFQWSGKAHSSDKDLQQIFGQGENLLNKMRSSRQSSQPIAAQLDSVAKRRDPVNSLTSSLATAANLPQSAYQNHGPDNRETMDLNAFLKNEREETLMSLIDETLRDAYEDAERAFEREQLKYVDQYKLRLQNSIPSANFNASPARGSRKSRIVQPISRSPMNEVELVFAQQIQKYTDKLLQNACIGSKKLIDMMLEASLSLRDHGYPELWKQVVCMMSVPFQRSGSGVKDPALLRSTAKFQLDLNNQALICLQKQFVDHMNSVVYGNLEKARHGGVPGTYSKVVAYLNVKLPSGYDGYEDGVSDMHPVWAVIYYCLRAGDVKTAFQVCERSGPALRQFSGIFREVAQAENTRLTGGSEMKIRSEYKRIAHSCLDPFKRAVLCWLTPCDSMTEFSEIEDKLEDCLWGRLIQTRHWERLALDGDSADSSAVADAPRAPGDRFLLKDLQRKIFEEYGEKHFQAGQSPMLYWTALWVTGQFEAALEFLCRQGEVLRCHAVHAALVAQETGLLITPNDVKTPLTSVEKNDSTGALRLNSARLILIYTAKFEVSDPREALNYLYYLRNFHDNKSGEESLFVSSLSELVRKSNEFAMLLGRMEPDGCRKPGLIDKFDGDFDSSALIESVAKDCESEGKKEEAVRLYDLAGKHDKVMKLLSRILSQLAGQPHTNPDRQRFGDLAVAVASRYRRQGSNASESISSTFYLLMDVMTFFEMCQTGEYGPAIEVMRKLRIVPLAPEEVDRFLNAFHMVPEEVRILLADIMIAVMQALNEEYRKLRNTATGVDRAREKEAVEDIRRKGKALILYGGLLPYRLPGDTTGRLVQLELLLH